MEERKKTDFVFPKFGYSKPYLALVFVMSIVIRVISSIHSYFFCFIILKLHYVFM